MRYLNIRGDRSTAMNLIYLVDQLVMTAKVVMQDNVKTYAIARDFADGTRIHVVLNHGDELVTMTVPEKQQPTPSDFGQIIAMSRLTNGKYIRLSLKDMTYRPSQTGAYEVDPSFTLASSLSHVIDSFTPTTEIHPYPTPTWIPPVNPGDPAYLEIKGPFEAFSEMNSHLGSTALYSYYHYNFLVDEYYISFPPYTETILLYDHTAGSTDYEWYQASGYELGGHTFKQTKMEWWHWPYPPAVPADNGFWTTKVYFDDVEIYSNTISRLDSWVQHVQLLEFASYPEKGAVFVAYVDRLASDYTLKAFVTDGGGTLTFPLFDLHSVKLTDTLFLTLAPNILGSLNQLAYSKREKL